MKNRQTDLPITILDDYTQLSRRAAELVLSDLAERPGTVLALPTGATPEGMYGLLRTRPDAFRRTRVFNLDEYIGLGSADQTSFAAFLSRHLLDHLRLPAAQVRLLNGQTPAPQAECEAHEAAIAAAGGLDLVILGLGGNGHIGFNEPGSLLDSRTRPVQLTEQTRLVNARYFPVPAAVPERALTIGIGTILEARQILLLASGPAKAEAVVRMMTTAPSPAFPASALRLHPRVKILVDKAAARLL